MEVNEGEKEVICLFIVNGVMDQWKWRGKEAFEVELWCSGDNVFLWYWKKVT